MMIFLRYICFALVLPLQVLAQDESPNTQFWNAVQSHCGKAYEGVLELPEEDEGFGGKRLVMHVRSCGADQIKIHYLLGNLYRGLFRRSVLRWHMVQMNNCEKYPLIKLLKMLSCTTFSII
jgi:hypothetical protein